MNQFAANSEKLEIIDKLIVPGRGVKWDGGLTENGKRAAEVAVAVGRLAHTKLIHWTGGRSWRQSLAGVSPVSEGEAGMNHAIRYGGQPPQGRKYSYEGTSESAVKGFINSVEALDMQPGETLGIVGDDLFFTYGRPQRTAKLVLPGVQVVPIKVPREVTKADIREEWQMAAATRLFMRGVRSGDLEAIARRQEMLEKVNAGMRRIIGFAARPNELETESHLGEFSPLDTTDDSPRPTEDVLAGVYIGRPE